MLKAFKQEKEADLVIDFYTWEEWKIVKPDCKKLETLKVLNQEILGEILLDLDIKHNSVVIILDKRDSEVEIEDIEKFIQNFNFKKIIFQAGVSNLHPDGRPILKE